MRAPILFPAILSALLGCTQARSEAAKAAPVPPSPPKTEAPRAEPQAAATGPLALRLQGKPAEAMATLLAAGKATPSAANVKCGASAQGVATCGLLLDKDGVSRPLDTPEQAPLVVTEARISMETGEGRKLLRVRYEGEPARSVATLLNPQLARQPGAIIPGKDHSCVVTPEGLTICGFLLAADGRTYDLEAYGYQ